MTKMFSKKAIQFKYCIVNINFNFIRNKCN